MVKTMNVYLKNLAMAAVTSLSLISCSDDDSSQNTTYYTARATVTSELDQTLTLNTDGGNLLTIISDYGSYAPSKGQRSMVTYSKVSGQGNVYNADLHSAYDLLTKDVVELTADNQASIGNDPIHLYKAWCAGGFLNVNFGFNTSGNTTHYVNLVENSLASYPDDGKIYLEFRHNAMGDSENYGQRGTVCFDLAKYQNNGQTQTFVIMFTEFDGAITLQEIGYDFVNDTIIEESEWQVGDGLYE